MPLDVIQNLRSYEREPTNISVLIRTTGRVGRFSSLQNLLKSLGEQTVTDFELVVATETNGRVIEELIDRYRAGCKNLVLETNIWNRCRSTNKAIRVSGGEIVVILEDDLTLERGWLEKAIRTFKMASADVGCVYSPCTIPHKEALKYRKGITGMIANLLLNLTLSKSFLPRSTKRVGDGLYEVPTLPVSCAAFKREALFKAGLFDEMMMEPLRGDDYELGFRMYKLGHRIISNHNMKAVHYVKYVSRRSHKSPKYFENFFLTEMYSYAKHLDLVGLRVLPHSVYMVIEGFMWALRTRKLTVLPRIIKGIMIGFFKGVRNREN